MQELLQSKLEALRNVSLTTATAGALSFELIPHFDVVIDIAALAVEGHEAQRILSSDRMLRCFHAVLVPGGSYIGLVRDDTATPRALWSSSEVIDLTCPITLRDDADLPCKYVKLRKAAVCCNSSGALYWVDPETADHHETSHRATSQELDHLERITITPSASQRKRLQGESPTAPLAMKQQAVEVLRSQGVCILRGFFNPQVGATPA